MLLSQHISDQYIWALYADLIFLRGTKLAAIWAVWPNEALFHGKSQIVTLLWLYFFSHCFFWCKMQWYQTGFFYWWSPKWAQRSDTTPLWVPKATYQLLRLQVKTSPDSEISPVSEDSWKRLWPFVCTELMPKSQALHTLQNYLLSQWKKIFAFKLWMCYQ